MNKKGLFILCAFCILVLLNAISAQAVQDGEMKGTILTVNGDPLSHARVCMYNKTSGPPPFSGEYWRVCEFKTRTEEDGSFSLHVPSGNYYFMTTMKTTDEKPGPPVNTGDLIWPPFDGSESRTYIVTEEGPTDLGLVAGAVPFKREWLPKGETAIEGRILLKDGTPVEGVLVYASGDREMNGLVFLSDGRTGQDGKYLVRVVLGEEDGQFFARAMGASKSTVKAEVYSGEVTRGIDIRVKKNPSNRWDKQKKNKKE